MSLTHVSLRALAVVGLISAASLAAHAGSVDLSTGLDPSYNLITAGNTPDGFWTVDQPGGGTAPAKVDAPGFAGFPGSAWAPNGPASDWITIDPNSTGNGSVIPYTYYRSFTVSAADLATASITGTWGIDDSGKIKLNGNTLSTLVNDYTASTPFSAAAGSGFFVAGVNTLTVTMTSSDNAFEAVRVTATLDGVSVVPEPSTIIVALSGVVVAVLARSRVRRSVG